MAYSALSALRVLDWRYGDQIAWRLVVIGLSESNRRYVDRGFTPATMALGNIDFRDRFGMPFAEARSAEGSAAELQGKTATTDGPVRFTAPSLILKGGGRRLVAGGWQTVEAYDVLVANLDPGLERREPPPGVEPLLARFPDGRTTQEAAALLVHGNDALDRDAAEAALVVAAGEGRATRTALGDDALWRAA